MVLVSTIVAQSVSPSFVTSLPDIIDESSGVELLDDGKLVSFNDSGGENELYIFNDSGNLLRTIEIVNATNIDWEEIARDDDGWFYIGDFGNNSNNRTDLRIYAIPGPEDFIEDTISAEIINFTYEDQYEFPPPSDMRNFDMEAMVSYGDSLYLFSKCRTDPFTGITKLYSLPKYAGDYEARLIDSIYTTTSSELAGQVTAADISSVGEVFVMTYRRGYILSGYSGSNFMSGAAYEISISTLTQIEACCFINPEELYITDEIVTYMGIDFGGALSTVDIGDYLAIEEFAQRNRDKQISAYPNPFEKKVKIENPKNLSIVIVDISGSIVTEFGDENSLSWKPDSRTKPGIYFACIKNSTGKIERAIKLMYLD